MHDTGLARIASTFGMSDRVWARHANPWSGWTRLPVAPLLALAVWSRAWIGGWCLLPLALLLAWTWLNPRAFPPPARADGWMSRAVHGERVLLNAAAVPIPPDHARAARLLARLPALGLPPLAWGLWALDAGWTVAGLALAIYPKLWFLDRMARLYDDMAARHPPYRAWAAPRGTGDGRDRR